MSQREHARLTKELGRLQVQGGREWRDKYMAIDALYKDRDSRMQSLGAEVRRQSEAYVEERTMRRMIEE